MDLDVEALRQVALRVADAADAESLARFGGQVRADRKADGSFVTAADQAVEHAVRHELASATPAFAILGEEQGGAIDPASPTWVVDPIDATNNYLRGNPIYATLIGLVVQGRAVVGVASAPAMGERWDAAQGLGARRNGEPVRVSGITDLAEAQLCHGGLSWWRSNPSQWALLGKLSDLAWRTRAFGDFWEHLLVAGGIADVAIQHSLSPWDVAALECIVTEAGGAMTSFDGRSAITTGQALTTNGALHRPLMALLGEADW